MRNILLFLFAALIVLSGCGSSKSLSQGKEKTDSTGVHKAKVDSLHKDDSTHLKKDDSTGVKKKDSTGVKRKETSEEHTIETIIDTTIHLAGKTMDLPVFLPNPEALAANDTLRYKAGDKTVEITPKGKGGWYNIRIIDEPKDITVSGTRKETNRKQSSEFDSSSVRTIDSTVRHAVDSTARHIYDSLARAESDSTHLDKKAKYKDKEVERSGWPWWLWALVFVVVGYVAWWVISGTNPYLIILRWLCSKKKQT